MKYNLEKHSKYRKADIDSDSEELTLSGQHITAFKKPEIKHSMDYWLDEDIREPSYYRPMLQYLYDMQQHDECRIWINTSGGNLSSCMAIVDAIQETEGQCVCIIQGSAYSAGSIIALSAPNLIVGQHSDMMLHTASFGFGGKTSDVVTRIRHEERQIKKIMLTAYKDFLDATELDALINGRDFWFDADEITERLERRALVQAEVQAGVEAHVQTEVKPKPKAKVKAKA